MSKKTVEIASSAIRRKGGRKIKKQTKIMVFGTFDGLHQGHLNFFNQARNLVRDSFLIASIARDRNVLKIKGRHTFLSEKKRAGLVKKSGLVNKVVLAGLKRHIPHIIKERPDIIALGYDQKVYVKNLTKDLKSKGIFAEIIRLKPYKEKIYKNHLLNKKR